MKKLLIVALAVALFSCQKKKCWTCHPEAVDPAQGVGISMVPEEMCDMTERDINDYKEEHRGVTYKGILVDYNCAEYPKQ